ncbi:ethylbenzene dehydrogenase-related protein [Thiocapsa sp. UBA6158]|uniref:ethylbenzene dehydrogenase-related protein n=1 Tax=Thiocapsa sp. UBA6158 TaxID=1947692 RepID=UPI0025CF464C|nr:ethylbenzene dehydrogenase-related protein [Thiocapsa sp. UBA6158]
MIANPKRQTTALSAMLVATCAFSAPVLAARALETVTAIAFDTAPTLDGADDDAVWDAAAPAKLHFKKGANFDEKGSTDGTIRAARVGDALFLLLQYEDSTHSEQRSPYVKQTDGSWKKLKDPNDVGGDNNSFYEDKAALIWPIDNSIPDFEADGCFAACHDDEPPKPYGNKYTENEGERGDMWHIKTVRTGPVGQVDDQWLDHTRFDPETAKNAGRKSDAKTGGGYADIALVEGVPEFMSGDGKAANKGGAYWVMADEKVPFDDSRFEPGDEVASIMIAPFEGDRGDIALGLSWNDGVWSMEMRRKLVTGSETDVQFEDLTAAYPFAVSVFDNAQVRHAFMQKPIALVFEE